MPNIKKLALSVLSMCTAGTFIAAVCMAYATYAVKSPGPLAQTNLVLVERGEGVSAIATTLEQSGVVSSSFLFKASSILSPDKRPLQAGEYEFPAHISLLDTLQMMKDGKVYDRKITIPEGLTSHQIVRLLMENEALSGEIADIPEDGSLLPETYHFIRGDSRESLLAEMRAGMIKTMEALWPSRSKDLPFKSEKEAMTLASIVEKETGVAPERTRVAGVFINRLRQGIPLQSDPTVIYAMTGGDIQDQGQGPIGRRLLTKDLVIDSPYNTYENPGLPPGPIANPGKASIEAVLNPEKNDYIYFVADGKGGHVFARTLSEHNQNVARWRKLRQQGGQ